MTKIHTCIWPQKISYTSLIYIGLDSYIRWEIFTDLKHPIVYDPGLLNIVAFLFDTNLERAYSNANKIPDKNLVTLREFSVLPMEFMVVYPRLH